MPLQHYCCKSSIIYNPKIFEPLLADPLRFLRMERMPSHRRAKAGLTRLHPERSTQSNAEAESRW